ncbi:MAG: KH domain-containing protein [Actinomycetota bacterium]|nr:KH domain-containing protein [Actinomycetota bacterium]
MSESFDAPGDVAGAGDADQGLADDAGNRAGGGTARSVLEYMARQIVDEPDAVLIELDERAANRVDLRLHVAPDDMGKIIGRRGRVAQAIRTVVRAAGAREGVETTVDIVD